VKPKVRLLSSWPGWTGWGAREIRAESSILKEEKQ